MPHPPSTVQSPPSVDAVAGDDEELLPRLAVGERGALAYFDGLSVAEIASRTRLPPGAVSDRLARGMHVSTGSSRARRRTPTPTSLSDRRTRAAARPVSDPIPPGGSRAPEVGVTVESMNDETRQLHGGRLLVEVSNRIVGVFRDYSGKGPSRCKTHWAGPDLLVVLLRGGFTIAEQTLYDGGRGMAVRDARHALQDTLESRLVEVVEELTGRAALAFMSTSHQNPDLQVELFLLEPDASAAFAEADDVLPGEV